MGAPVPLHWSRGGWCCGADSACAAGLHVPATNWFIKVVFFLRPQNDRQASHSSPSLSSLHSHLQRWPRKTWAGEAWPSHYMIPARSTNTPIHSIFSCSDNWHVEFSSCIFIQNHLSVVICLRRWDVTQVQVQAYSELETISVLASTKVW